MRLKGDPARVPLKEVEHVPVVCIPRQAVVDDARLLARGGQPRRLRVDSLEGVGVLGVSVDLNI